MVQSTPRTSLAGNIPGRWDRDGVVHPINVPKVIYVPKRDQSKKYYWDIHRVRRTSLSDILCMSWDIVSPTKVVLGTYIVHGTTTVCNNRHLTTDDDPILELLN